MLQLAGLNEIIIYPQIRKASVKFSHKINSISNGIHSDSIIEIFGIIPQFMRSRVGAMLSFHLTPPNMWMRVWWRWLSPFPYIPYKIVNTCPELIFWVSSAKNLYFELRDPNYKSSELLATHTLGIIYQSPVREREHLCGDFGNGEKLTGVTRADQSNIIQLLR